MTNEVSQTEKNYFHKKRFRFQMQDAYEMYTFYAITKLTNRAKALAKLQGRKWLRNSSLERTFIWFPIDDGKMLFSLKLNRNRNYGPKNETSWSTNRLIRNMRSKVKLPNQSFLDSRPISSQFCKGRKLNSHLNRIHSISAIYFHNQCKRDIKAKIF